MILLTVFERLNFENQLYVNTIKKNISKFKFQILKIQKHMYLCAASSREAWAMCC